jgi:hypothetical protein
MSRCNFPCPDCGEAIAERPCPACGYDDVAAGEVVFVEPQYGRIMWFVVGVLPFGGVVYNLALAWFTDSVYFRVMFVVISGVCFIGGLWTVARGLRGSRTQVRFRSDGYAIASRLKPLQTYKPWPEHAFLRVRGKLFGGWTVVLGSREVSPKPVPIASLGQVNKQHVYRLVSGSVRSVHERILAGRRFLPQPSPTRADVDQITHCPACVYDMRHVPSRTCPECGFTSAEGDVVLFGRAGPTAVSVGGVFGLKGVLTLVGLMLGGAVAGGASVVLLFFLWRNLPPGWSHVSIAALAVLILGVGAASIARVTRYGEAKRERDDRLADAATGPAGQTVLRLHRDGFAQHSLGRREVKLRPYDAGVDWRVQLWPGGLRVRCDRPSRWRWRRRTNRPIDYLCDVADPRAAARQVRRRLRDLQR